jgi:hypothetical protein
MAITNFIPELWAAAMLEQWNAVNVWAGLTNREYEGTLARGNKIHITGVVAPTVKDYAAGHDGVPRTTEAEAITDTTVEMVIDQEKSTDFYVDDIDRAQAAGSLASYTTAAGYAMAEDTDKFLANLAVAGGTDLITDITSPTTGDDAFDLVRDARKQLNKENVPSDGRILVCNAEFEGLLLGADSKLTTADAVGDSPSQGLRNATIGNLLGCKVVTSNHLPAVDSPQFVMFAIRALAFASQIDKVEAMRAQNKFADRLRALHVYGGKVIRPEGIAVFNADGS